MNQKIIISSLAMDLKRVALGLHRGSFNMAHRFKKEALKRSEELKISNSNSDAYLEKLLERVKESLNKTGDQVAEDALMYSTLFQNLIVKRV
ncbi:hypothetical protein A3H85_00120 [Candidatus Daviesbacteria bacterium RIFCSPLOWO2_02_FULL_40_8]|uniref:Uncharacterized protein n=1 Tax=Candidatus Daviesbacteria bacterium RIFCSPLOWO2_01_FULL_40_24 TaxID=1797787 RepID=A0A1F5MKD4_9BACT|nr:MAG: hypothetical protein A2780_02320 [Candidatus Daviesbacteria bacterium RIFCSPHIGHO2_01_FULL_41_45]OGE34608.1 MAG: hypothetical protein A3C32_02630 [Candidatus Daviesbacteria bacterium RIFCSPHIGHO2_02_FULL_41_14]OGE65846.1 MAG: hypothetical protein A3B49_03240 [Candidatus Daviesbacteria bacterium RIFCSPLOWO2_01_FULL_40_24]OGE66846.1 MAG: hypothetical protein A3H85_00120 [Candidatus Daviesbacteria bacterium RIFCSPLOWO2_02_FULL_40_8]